MMDCGASTRLPTSLDMQTPLLTFPLRGKEKKKIKKFAAFPTVNKPMKTRTAEL